MKKLYTSLFLIFLSMFAFSQEKDVAKGLDVHNKTECTQFFVIEWVDNCNCSIGNGGVSDIIKIAPNEFMFIVEYPFVIATKVGGGHYCSGSSPVGQPCSNHPFTAQYMEYIKYGEDCKEYTETLATWKPGDCYNPAILTFTNL